jgi:dimethylargininase
LINRAWIDVAALADFEILTIPDVEPWGANVLPLGTTVLSSSTNLRTVELLRGHGFTVRPVDLSEFAKAEGGVTCLSLLI